MNEYIKFLVLNLIRLTLSVGAELLIAPDLPSQGIHCNKIMSIMLH